MLFGLSRHSYCSGGTVPRHAAADTVCETYHGRLGRCLSDWRKVERDRINIEPVTNGRQQHPYFPRASRWFHNQRIISELCSREKSFCDKIAFARRLDSIRETMR